MTRELESSSSVADEVVDGLELADGGCGGGTRRLVDEASIDIEKEINAVEDAQKDKYVLFQLVSRAQQGSVVGVTRPLVQKVGSAAMVRLRLWGSCWLGKRDPTSLGCTTSHADSKLRSPPPSSRVPFNVSHLCIFIVFR